MNYEAYEYTIPDYFLLPLIYGDDTNLSDEEVAELDDFLKSIKSEGYWTIDDDQESYFSGSNDVNWIAGFVIDVIWLQEVQEVEV